MKKMKAYTLVEVMVASAIIVAGLLMLYLAFVQSQRLATRNDSTSVGLSLLKTQMDADSKQVFASVQLGGPTYTAIDGLPNAQLARTVTFQSLGPDPNTGIKTIHYVLTWSGGDGPHTLQTDYELVQKGLDN